MPKPVYLVIAANLDTSVYPIGIFSTKNKAIKFAVNHKQSYDEENGVLHVFETTMNQGLHTDWELGDYAKVFKHIPLNK